MYSTDIPVLNIPDAYKFYKKYLLDLSKEKAEFYRQYGFKIVGSISSQDWELFGAMLMRDRAKSGASGADLERHEVKSATTGNSFEYQYHKNHGLAKLADDAKVDHLYISYSNDYENVEVRVLRGADLMQFFDRWRPKLLDNYAGAVSKQRFRKSVSYTYVVERGTLLLRIQGGKIIHPSGHY